VLPKNVFLYVASIPNLAALGTRFVLQGGTQNNMAVVKAEVDFIHNSFRAAGKKPEIIVHEFCGESGAIGAAVESLRLWRNGLQTSFVGLEAVRKFNTALRAMKPRAAISAKITACELSSTSAPLPRTIWLLCQFKKSQKFR